MRTRFRGASLVLAALLVAGLSTTAAAQYFGANKVQYRTFQFQVLETDHFDVYYYPAEREGAEIAARLAERWYARLSGVFDHQLRGRQPLILYASHVDFEQTNVIAGAVGEGTGGVTESLRRRIVLPFAGPLADTDHVLGHELVHAFQYDLTARRDGSRGTGAGLERLPLWFVEGMAEYLSLGPEDPHTAMWLRDAARAEKLPAIRDLVKPEYFPYRWGHAYWAYVAGRWGDGVIRSMLTTAAQAGDTGLATEKVLGVKEDHLSAAWQNAIEETFVPSRAVATPVVDRGETVIQGRPFGGSVNVGPALSPDGRWIAFLSERSLFSIDLFVADAKTGTIVKKLTDTGVDPHYGSLQFIHSAGAWDAQSRRLAAATVTKGRPALAVFDWPSGSRQMEVIIDGVDEIFNPTWSPDGEVICFTGMRGGLTDLFVYDLSTSSLRRLTNDVYADMQPAWSPDGRRVAFATDRFSSDLDRLGFGALRLALIDLDTGSIERVPAFVSGKHIDPQWSSDGTSLYFVSDRNGISNLYRVDLSSGAFEQLTTSATGVSGITASSPALSVAPRANLAAVTVYEQGTYSIRTLRLDVPGGAFESTPSNASTLPPIERTEGQVAAFLADHRRGLPVPTTYPESEYRSRLSLESAGQTTIAVGMDRFGTAFGAGLGLTFSDMLNNHRLGTVVQFNSGITGGVGLRDTGAQVSYLNQARRWNWGVVGGQIPYLTGGARTGVGVVDGQRVQFEEVVVYRQTERTASGIAIYPFDRARRIEVQGGMSQISFGQEIRTDAYSLSTGRRVFSDTSRTSLGDTLNLATTSGAFVSDISQFGATSPVRGERYRLEAAPTFGTINFTTLLGDYRRYLMPVSFYTVALRGLHYGRYGSDSEDGRLAPLYLGYPTLVRGYDVGSLDASECVPTATSACPVFDRLVGSRLLVGNVEWRFPLLRPFGVSSRMYGPLPVEVGLFADGGVAWRKGETPSLTDETRGGVSSAGVTFRVNLFGFGVGQFDIVRPFQRPAAGWVFQFNLAQGY